MNAALDRRVLQVSGVALLLGAAFFGWGELALEPVLVVVVVSGALTALALAATRSLVRWLGPALLGLAVIVSGLTWLATKQTVVLTGVVVPVLAAAWVARALHRTPPSPGDAGAPPRLAEFLSWQTLAAGALFATGGAYFHLLTLQTEDLARRLVLTLAWALLGVGGVVLGRKLGSTAPRDAGFVVLAAALTKVVLYDTTHLFGGLRIGALAAVGAVLLLASFVVDRVRRVESR